MSHVIEISESDDEFSDDECPDSETKNNNEKIIILDNINIFMGINIDKTIMFKNATELKNLIQIYEYDKSKFEIFEFNELVLILKHDRNTSWVDTIEKFKTDKTSSNFREWNLPNDLIKQLKRSTILFIQCKYDFVSYSKKLSNIKIYAPSWCDVSLESIHVNLPNDELLENFITLLYKIKISHTPKTDIKKRKLPELNMLPSPKKFKSDQIGLCIDDWFEILLFVREIQDIINLMKTCKMIRDIIKLDIFWKIWVQYFPKNEFLLHLVSSNSLIENNISNYVGMMCYFKCKRYCWHCCEERYGIYKGDIVCRYHQNERIKNRKFMIQYGLLEVKPMFKQSYWIRDIYRYIGDNLDINYLQNKKIEIEKRSKHSNQLKISKTKKIQEKCFEFINNENKEEEFEDFIDKLKKSEIYKLYKKYIQSKSKIDSTSDIKNLDYIVSSLKELYQNL